MKWGRAKRFTNNAAQGSKARRAAERFRAPAPKAAAKPKAPRDERRRAGR